MTTITSPDGRTHLIQTHPTVYRGVRTDTVTWCGIRATRGWMPTRSTSSTCAVCQRRHDGAAGADAPSSDVGERGPAEDALPSEGPTDADLETHGRGDGTEGDDGIWSRPNPQRQPAEDDIWSRPSQPPTVTGNTFILDDG